MKIKRWIKLVMFLSLLIVGGTVSAETSSTLAAPLAGTYVIGTGQDYNTLNDAVNDLNALGISAPVSFRLRYDTTFDEHVTINDFTRTGAATDTVTFEPSSTLFDTHLEYSGASASQNWIFRLNGADYIIIDDLVFETVEATSTYGRIIVLENGADHNVFRRNDMDGFASGDDDASLIYAQGSQNQFNIVENSTFTSGYRGIDFQSTDGSTRSDGNVVDGNTFENQIDRAIHLRYQANPQIKDNIINDIWFSNSSWVGIFVDGKGAEITHNTIDSEQGSKGIQLQSTPDTVVDRLIANNMINMRDNSNADAGIILTSGYVNLYHNTVRIGGSDADSAPLRVNGGTLFGINLANNLFVNDGGGFAMRVPVSGNINTSDYNDFYTSGSSLVEWDGNSHADLAAYQAASGQDTNSTERAVTFVDDSTGDLHLSGSSVGEARLAAPALAAVTNDIDGNVRNIYSVNKGAEEAAYLGPLDNGDTGSGFYTVGGNSPDFTTPQKAILHLNYRGIKGPVTFNIRAGTYDTHATIGEFARYDGARAGTETVEFRAANSNNRPILSYAATSSADNWIIKIDGADLIYLNKLDFIATGTGQWGRIIVLDEDSDNFKLEACDLTGVTGQTSNAAALIFGNNVYTGDLTSVLDSSFTNGSYGIYLKDDQIESPNVGTQIKLNTFDDAAVSAIVIDRYSPSIISNDITSSVAGAVSGIHVKQQSNFEVLKNKIRMDDAGDIGLMIVGKDNFFNPFTSLVANNFVIADTGIQLDSGPRAIHFYHNTVYSTGDYAFYVVPGSGGSTNKVFNNIFYATVSSGYAMHNTQLLVIDDVDIDYNVFYNGSGGSAPLVNWGGSVYNTLSPIQSSLGLNSVGEEVLGSTGVEFVNAANGNLHLTASSDGNVALGGTVLADVPDDIDGDTRTLYAPYMGADEASPLPVATSVTLSNISLFSGGLPDVVLVLMLGLLLVSGVVVGRKK